MNSTCPQKTVRLRRNTNQPITNNEEERYLKELYLHCLRRYEQTGTEREKAELLSKAKKDYDMKFKNLRRQSSADHIANAENKSKALWQVINKWRKIQKTGPTQLELNIRGQK